MKGFTILDLRFTIVAVVGLLLASCGAAKIVHVPVETVRTEYVDRFQRDSIFHRDSIFMDRWREGDTVFVNREVFQLRYVDRIIRDSVVVVDSIQVPFPVEVVHEVNVLTRWQRWRLWIGNIMLILAAGFAGYKVIKLKRLKR